MKGTFYKDSETGQVYCLKEWGQEVPQSIAKPATDQDKADFHEEWEAFSGEELPAPRFDDSTPIILNVPALEAGEPKKLITEA